MQKYEYLPHKNGLTYWHTIGRLCAHAKVDIEILQDSF